MEKKKYTLNFTIITVDGDQIRETATTWEDEGLVNAENNIAWRYVVAENESAKYKGAIIEFDSGRKIDGSKRNLKHTPLYLVLLEDLWDNGIYWADPKLAKQLRQQFKITYKDYAKKSEEVINYMKGYKEEKNMNNVENNPVTVNQMVVEENKSVSANTVEVKEEKNMNEELAKMIEAVGIENVKAKLEELLNQTTVKQETTVTQQSETVDNKNGAAAENKAESAVETADKKEEKTMEEKKVVIPENEYDDLASLDNTITGKTSNDIVINFLIKQNGVDIEAVRNITVWNKRPEDPDYMYKGGIFEGRKYVGHWKWDTRPNPDGFYCPCFVTKANTFYSYNQDEAGNPTSNVSRMLKAIAEALTAERGIKSEATYRAPKKGKNTRVVDFTSTSVDYDGAPTRIENVRPARKIVGTAKVNPAPAPEVESQLPTESEFWGVCI